MVQERSMCHVNHLNERIEHYTPVPQQLAAHGAPVLRGGDDISVHL